MRIYYCIFIMVSLGWAGCDFGGSAAAESKFFFPLHSFFEKEIRSLKKESVQIEKRAVINGVEETGIYYATDTVHFDLKKEFKPFLQADINKPAFQDQYSTEYDTLENGVVQIHRARSESLTTREIKAWKQDGRVIRIEIITVDNNKVYHTRQHLTYVPDTGYSIEARQKVMLTGAKEYLVEGRFVQ